MMKRLALLLGSLGVAAALAARADDAKKPDLVARTRTRLHQLQRELEEMRGARFQKPVAIRSQTPEGCKKAFEAGLQGWLPQERSKRLSRAYARLGLLPKGYDFLHGLLDLYATQVFAYYQPGEATFYVIESGIPEVSVDPIMLHELDHALDDQRFGLDTLYALGAGKENDDLALAEQFLIEGEAYYITILSEAKARNDLEHLDALEEAEGLLDRDALEAEYRRRSVAMTEGKALYEDAASKRANLPLYVWRRYMEPYTKGCLMVSRVKRAGGWEAVDRLWKKPPISTEQVLHPEKLVSATRDEPVDVKMDELPVEGWKRTSSNVVGELGMQCVLSNRGVSDVAAVTSGWGGDRVESYEKDEQRTAVVWFTTWDTEECARRFERAFSSAECRHDDTLVERRAADVVVVEGAREQSQEFVRGAFEKARKKVAPPEER